MEHIEDRRLWMHETPEDLYERRNLGIQGRTKQIEVRHVAVVIGGQKDLYIIIDSYNHIWCFNELRDCLGNKIETTLSQDVTLRLQFGDEGEIQHATFVETCVEVTHTTSQR